MFESLKRSINAGVIDLPATKQKIQDFCAGGYITTDQMNQLLVLSEKKAGGLGGSPLDAVMESVLKRLDAIEAKLAIYDANADGEEGTIGPKDPSNLPVYTDGLTAVDGSVWIYEGRVYKSVAGDYGLAWGPTTLPQYWQDISAEYDLSKIA